ncbi:MAG TPA: glycosyltransferase [Chloroflexota bacterium]|jgi:1,2-diacylglycerol 3-beta-galactosyltransferase
MADTGGGHRALSRAIAAGIEDELGGRATIVDPFATTRRGPVRRLTRLYGPTIRRAPSLYGLAFALTDDPSRYRWLVDRAAGPLTDHIAEILLEEHPDAVVFAHPLAVQPGMNALERVAATQGRRPVAATMLAELVTIHTSWIDRRVQRYFAGTDEVATALRRAGIPDQRTSLTGLPVGPLFGRIAEPVPDARRRLRLIPDRTTALLLAGGEGSGPVVETVTRLSRALPDLQLVVVCGRNARLRQRLEEYCLPPEVRVLGFVENMPELMHAADFVITKGGPQSIAEALAAGKPMIVTHLLPGQEQGNGAFVVRRGAGYLGLTLPDVLAATRRLVHDAPTRQRLAAAARAAGRPEAAGRVARELAAMVERNAAARR